METLTGPIVDYERLYALADQSREQYRGAEPFPNITFEDFLVPQTARLIASLYKQVDWQTYKHYNENKQGNKLRNLPSPIRSVVDELNSPPFLEFLRRLTGIENLISDPELGSGGIHQSGRGGYLNIHADFTVHPYHADWHRRINVLVYLNEAWEDSWGGHFELWSRDVKRCEKKIAPLFNRCAIFNTSVDSFHGHPDPMTCPEDVKRKSIALYYYTLDSTVTARATEYRPRPGDRGIKPVLILFDKMAVRLFHHMKSTLRVKDTAFTALVDFWRKDK
jgi:hypothetical protein